MMKSFLIITVQTQTLEFSHNVKIRLIITVQAHQTSGHFFSYFSMENEQQI